MIDLRKFRIILLWHHFWPSDEEYQVISGISWVWHSLKEPKSRNSRSFSVVLFDGETSDRTLPHFSRYPLSPESASSGGPRHWERQTRRKRRSSGWKGEINKVAQLGTSSFSTYEIQKLLPSLMSQSYPALKPGDIIHHRSFDVEGISECKSVDPLSRISN